MLTEFASDASKSYFQRKFPYQSDKSYMDVQALDIKYKNWKVVYIFIALGLFFTLPFVYTYIIHPLLVFTHRALLIKEQIYFPPSMIMLGILSFFLSMATLIYVAEWVMRLFLKFNADEFFDCYNHSQKYDNRKAGIWFGKIFFIISLPLYPFFLTAKIATSEKTFTIKTVVDFNERIYRYNELKTIHY